MLNGLDLFSGIGGLTLALSEWVRPIAYCENDRYAQAVLLSRMAEGNIVRAPIWDDVSTLSREDIPGEIDIIYGGFPCQDISCAGLGAGLGGERSGLFFEVVRLASELKPSFVFLENVPAIRTRGLRQVVGAFTDLGYDTRWTCVSAAELGAPHLRKRWFLLAHTSSERCREARGFRRDEPEERTSCGHQANVADAKGERSYEGSKTCGGSTKVSQPVVNCSRPLGDAKRARSQGRTLAQTTWQALAEHRHSSERDWPSWLPKPALHRGDNGLLFRVDRTHSLGNSVVPEQAEEAFQRLAGLR